MESRKEMRMFEIVAVPCLLLFFGALVWMKGRDKGRKEGFKDGLEVGIHHGERSAEKKALEEKTFLERTLKERLEDLDFDLRKPHQAVIAKASWYDTQENFIADVGPLHTLGCGCCGALNEIYSVCGRNQPQVGLYGIFCLVCGRGLRVPDDNVVREQDLTKVLPRWEDKDFSAEVIRLVPKARNDNKLQ